MLRSLLKIFNPGPVSARVEFEDRSYELGSSMNLSVELNARREIDVEEARLDLECEERWADTYVKMEPLGRTGGMIGRGKPMPGLRPQSATSKSTPTRSSTAALRSPAASILRRRRLPGTTLRSTSAKSARPTPPAACSSGVSSRQSPPGIGEPVDADRSAVRVDVP